ncbi:MAG TPA: hypothetical protein VFS15_29030 [Kofleriaceae bacterium]|nr:hypothetical protein [Kofleriaceae bacterium]
MELADLTSDNDVACTRCATLLVETFRNCGYAITGATPDANGLGQPDIHMAKRIVPR